MFKKILALLLATMMVLGGMVTVAAEEAEAPAEEVVDTVDYDAIYAASADKLAALDILKGNGVDYALDDYVQRWHMALFVARIMSGETKDEFWNEVADNTTKFDDVDNFFGAIDYVSERGIVKGKGWIPGVGSNCFAPNESIILQDALTMVVRALGYKQLENYPDDFVAKAEALGLTAGLEELELTAPLTRGQMVQILTNTLFTEIDGTSFAKANFGLEEQTYVIVATEFQALLGAEKVMRVDYLDSTEKWVALAPINVDGTYDFDSVVYFTEAELGLAYNESEQKLGYSYVVTSFNAFKDVANVAPVEPAYFSNYGSQVEIAAGSKYTVLGDSAIIKIGEQTYRLVPSYTELSNKPTYTNKQPEIIVHSMYNGESELESYNFIYDLSGNILDPNGELNADGMLPIAIYYTAWNNTYFVQKDGGFQYATEQDFINAAVGSVTSAPRFGVVTEANKLTGYKFSEIAMFDDDNDGDFDRGVFMPYSVGLYNVADAKKDSAAAKATLRDKKGTTASSATKYVTISGESIDGYFYGSTGLQKYTYLNDNAIEYVLYDAKPTAGQYFVYNYNVYTRTLTVIQNLGKPETGVVTDFKANNIKLDGNGNFVLDGKDKVVINDTIYNIGYTNTDAYYNASADAEGFKTLSFEYIDGDINGAVADRAYLSDIYAAIFSKTQLAKFIALDDTVIYFEPVEPATVYSEWILFDYGTEDTEIKNGYTVYDYEGDIVGVTDDGLIIVNGYDSQADDTNGRVDIYIDKINNQQFGYLVEDYAILQYQFSGVGFITDANALETMKKIVIKNFFKTLTADLNTDENGDPADTNLRQYMFRAEMNEDGTAYNIFTDVAIYWEDAKFTTEQPEQITNVQDKIEFMDGISTYVYGLDSKGNQITTRLFTDKNTTIVIAGIDGIKSFKGMPADGAYLNLAGDETYVYNMASDYIVIVSTDKKCVGTATEAGIYYGYVDQNLEADGWTYYLLTSDTTLKLDNTYKYFTYSNLYNISEGKTETTPAIKNGLAGYNDVDDLAYLFNASYAALATDKAIGTIYAVKDNNWANAKVLTSIPTTYKNYTAVVNSKALLNTLLCAGNEDYAGVYSTAADLVGASSYKNELKLTTGTKTDRWVEFKVDVITYSDTAVKVLDDQDINDSDVKAGAIYYDYTKNVSFVGTLLVDATAVAPVGPAPVVRDLDTVRKNALDAINAEDAKYIALVTEQYDLIEEARTVEEIDVLFAEAQKIIADAKKADADATATAKDAAETAIAALEAKLAEAKDAGIKETDVVANPHTLKAFIDSLATYKTWNKSETEYKAAATAATNDVKLLDNAIKAKLENDALIADASIVTFEANKIVVNNLINVGNTITGFKVYKMDANNLYKSILEYTFTTTTASSKYLGVTWNATKAYEDATRNSIITIIAANMNDEAPLFLEGETYGVQFIFDNGASDIDFRGLVIEAAAE